MNAKTLLLVQIVQMLFAAGAVAAAPKQDLEIWCEKVMGVFVEVVGADPAAAVVELQRRQSGLKQPA